MTISAIPSEDTTDLSTEMVLENQEQTNEC